MKRSPELEALSSGDDVAVSNRNAKRNQSVLMIAFLFAGIAMAYLILRQTADQSSDLIRGEEEFNTTSFRPPSFARDQEVPAVKKPDVVAAPPVQQEQPVVPEVEEEFPQRFRSGLIQLDRQQRGNASDSDDGNSGLMGADGDRNSQFLARASAQARKAVSASKINRIDALVAEGTLIPGILETAIVSDLPGQVRAITSQDVYSFDGRRVLIPAGTRLIGEYQSDIITGQTRVFVVWTRLLRDDGVSVALNSIGADSLGRSGLTGVVDKKFMERFGASIMLSVVGAGASYLMGYDSKKSSDNSKNENNNPMGGVNIVMNNNAQSGEALARETIAKTFSEMADKTLTEQLKIKPTISIHQGERIFIFVRQDLDFSSIYDDPVTEALKEIRRERQVK